MEKSTITIGDIDSIISNTSTEDDRVYILKCIKEGKGKKLKLLSYVIAYQESKGTLPTDTVVDLDSIDKDLNVQIEDCENCELTSFDFCSTFNWMEDLVDKMNAMYNFKDRYKSNYMQFNAKYKDTTTVIHLQ